MMGYTTYFTGSFEIRPPLTPEHKAYLEAFAGTRRMKRNATVLFSDFDDPVRVAAGLPLGTDGGFYVGSTANHGQNPDESIVEYNRPPFDQPTLWCQWRPNADGTRLEWDEGEKFYSYTEWLCYLRDTFLTPWGYELGGQVRWQGEDSDDRGIIYAQGVYIEAIADDISNGPPEWYDGDDAEEEQEDLSCVVTEVDDKSFVDDNGIRYSFKWLAAVLNELQELRGIHGMNLPPELEGPMSQVQFNKINPPL